jgi:hypothetical protein
MSREVIVTALETIKMSGEMELSALTEKVGQLQAQVRAYRDRRARLTESDTIRVLILPLLGALGWDLNDLDEVKSEYRHKPADNPVDCALFLQRVPVLFVEAKALNERMEERRWLVQTLNYANAAGVDWCVLTNGDEYRIYKVHAPVEAEEKLFMTIRLDDGAPARPKAQQLALISRDRMRQREIDALWTTWRIDREVHRALEGLPTDESFVRFLSRRIPGVTQTDVRGSLRRAAFRVDYPQIGELLNDSTRSQDSARAELMGEPHGIDATEQLETIGEDRTPKDLNGGRRRFLKTADFVELGLLKPGARLRIKGRPDSTATVANGRQVDFNGERLSYNAWGCRVTGWGSIQIYSHALLEDGRLLEELRSDAASALSPAD